MLVLNSGSTSMKIALYREEAEVFSATENYDHQVLDRCGSINGQFDLRMDSVRKVMEEHGCSMADLSVIVSRGGSTKPLAHGGAYTINEKMAHDLRECPASSHAGNLGPMIAWELSRKKGIPAYIIQEAGSPPSCSRWHGSPACRTSPASAWSMCSTPVMLPVR